MNMQKLSYRIIALLMPVFAHAGDPAAQLHYDTPATQWNEALPLGNGRLGAMVFGTVEKEGIQFNEDTLWTGGPHDYTRPGGARHLPRVRELVKQRKFKDAQLLGDQHMVGVPKNLQAYQPLGDLALEFANLDGFEDYRRNLDMSTGIARVSYRSGGVQYTREVFASFPDQVIAIGLTCGNPDVSPQRKSMAARALSSITTPTCGAPPPLTTGSTSAAGRWVPRGCPPTSGNTMISPGTSTSWKEPTPPCGRRQSSSSSS